jgi:hypothetical protein
MEDLNLNKCIICIEDILTDIEYLPCAHSFHKECIDEWIKTVNTCPICKIPIYIDSPEHLTLYNYYKTIEDAESEAESRFFHQVSSGMFDQSVGNLNPTTPPQSSLNVPSFSEIVENKSENNNRVLNTGVGSQSVGILNPTTYDPWRLNIRSFSEILANNSENNLENNSENNSENNLENNSENNSENNLENNSENNSENNLENKSENRLENIIVLNADNLELFNSFIDVLASAVNYIDYVNIINDENTENDN